MDEIKTILITGATSGIGKATAEYLSGIGYRCILVARREEIMLKMIEYLSTDSVKHLYYKCDLNNLPSIEGLFDYINKHALKLDGFVHCAGVAPLLKVEDNNIDVMLKTFTINYFSFIEIMKYFLNPCNSNDGSSIIAISSVVAERGSYRQCIYGSSKAALNNSIKHIAKEVINRKIRVNSIMPGAVDTDMYRMLCTQSENLEDKIKILYPLGIIEVSNICKYISYLLSDDARFITGTTIAIDSGFLIH